jgi:hypothetical protein
MAMGGVREVRASHLSLLTYESPRLSGFLSKQAPSGGNVIQPSPIPPPIEKEQTGG